MKTELELVNIQVLNVGYASTQHKWGGADISSPFARLYYVKAGNAMLHMSDRDIELKPGYMYLVPSFMPHSYTCEPGFKFYYVFIYERYADSSGFFDIYDFPFEVQANEAANLMFENYCNLYPQLSLPYSSAEDFNDHPAYRDYAERYAGMDRYEKMQLQGLVWILASYFMKHAQKRVEHTDERLLEVCKFVKANLHREITLLEMADVACLTETHFCRRFKQAFGISPSRYVMRCKIQFAQQLLLTSDMTIHEISQRIGMKDTSYFIRIFKKQLSFTPKEYRTTLRY